jgi:hypothetical protein
MAGTDDALRRLSKTLKTLTVESIMRALKTILIVKNIALFLVAPFVGLIYLVAFPFVGFAMLAWMAGKALMKNRVARTVALTIAAPCVGLAYTIAFPIVGFAMLAWMGGKALLNRRVAKPDAITVAAPFMGLAVGYC